MADVDAVQKRHDVNDEENRPDNQIQFEQELALRFGIDGYLVGILGDGVGARGRFWWRDGIVTGAGTTTALAELQLLLHVFFRV